MKGECAAMFLLLSAFIYYLELNLSLLLPTNHFSLQVPLYFGSQMFWPEPIALGTLREKTLLFNRKHMSNRQTGKHKEA